MASISEIGNKYRNVIEKVKNNKVGNEIAWETAQPLLTHLVQGYPQEFSSYMSHIRTVFELRRDAYRQIERSQRSQQARALIAELDDETLDPVFASIRDLFDIPAPGKRNVQQYRDGY